ncbi:MAG: type II toxin-antitoxin system VapC family toxin [Planctomycetota bacterium]|nr:type II toxin-antitoxin system VapC family toxin [Planctomycetota bacterium]
MTSGYMLDTNHLSKAVRSGSVVQRKIVELRGGGARIGVCVPVLCEIEAGIQQISRPDDYRRDLERLLRQVRVWPFDLLTARIYGEIHHDLKRRGRVLSQVDTMLAALATQMNLTLVTSDQDFAALPDLSIANWLI